MPVSFACWYNPASVSVNAGLMTLGIPSGTQDNYYTLIAVSATLRAQQSQNGTAVLAASSNSLTTGAWYHCVAVFASANSRTVYLNGTAVSNATSNTPLTPTETAIGALLQHTGVTDPADGSIAFPTIWNIALSAGDVANLYNSGSGADPRTIESANLVSFSTLDGSTPWEDWASGALWTTTGAPTAGANPFNIAPVITVGAPASLTTTSEQLNATIGDTGGLNATVEGFHWGLTSGYGNTASSSGSFGTGAFSQTLTGLVQGTTYHYQAFATNSVGTTVSSDQTFTAGAVATGEVLFNGAQLSSGTTASGSVANLFDGSNLTTWTTSSDAAWAGIDCGAAVTLTRLRYTAQPLSEDLSLGATLNGDLSDPTFASPVLLATLSASIRPSTGTLMNEVDVSPGTPYRYYMVQTTASLTWGFADLDFIGHWALGVSSRPVQPTMSPPNGNFDTPTIVTISCISTSASIFYTTNGTTPTSSSTPYTGPILVSANTQLAAIAIDVNQTTQNSRVTTGFYLVNPSVLYSHEFMYDNRNYRQTTTSGSMFQDPIGGLWYLYYTDQDNNDFILNDEVGVNVYSSVDLRNWTYTGNIMGPPLGSQIGAFEYLSIRPKVFYCSATGLYVGWTGGSDVQAMRVYTSPYPDGRQPWTLVASYTTSNPCADGFLTGSSSDPGDIGGFIDPSTGLAYIIYNYNTNGKTAFSQLDPSSYTNTLGPSHCATYSSIGEGHAMAYNQGTYFYMYSGIVGDAYSVNQYSTSTSPIGPWSSGTNPFQAVSGSPVVAYTGDTPSPSNCYCGQTQHLTYIPGRNAWLWIGDDIGTLSVLYAFALIFPVVFTSPTTFTISWYAGNWFDGTAYSPWSLDALFPTVSGAPVGANNTKLISGNATWTNGDTLPVNLYFDSSSSPTFSSGVVSAVLPANATSFTPGPLQPGPYYRIRTVNANGTTNSGLFVVPVVVPPVTVSTSGYYVTLNFNSVYHNMWLVAGVNYAWLLQSVISGPYPDTWSSQQALIALDASVGFLEF